MASIRFSDYLRSRIADHIAKDLMQEDLDAELARRTAFETRLYELLTAQVRENDPVVVPATRPYVGISLRSPSPDVPHRQYYLRWNDEFPRLPILSVTVQDEELFNESAELDMMRHELDMKNHRIRAPILELLNTCTSSKQLLEVWPEASQYMDTFERQNIVSTGEHVRKRRLKAAAVGQLLESLNVDTAIDTSVTEETADAQA